VLPLPTDAPSFRMGPERLLPARLKQLGLAADMDVATHTNRTVMLSVTARGQLRLHLGYSHAPDRVLRAILRFLDLRQPKVRRRAAEREFLSFPVHAYAPTGKGPVRLERLRPGDDEVLQRLRETHRSLNARWFDDALTDIPFRLSSRMKTSLGELCLDARSKQAISIAISRRHLRRDGWPEVEHTVLHEMVHQWQAETDRAVDHGPEFRRKARAVGIAPAARRRIEAGAARAAEAARAVVADRRTGGR